MTRVKPRIAIIEGNVAKIPIGINAKDGYALVDIEDAWISRYAWCLSYGRAMSRSIYSDGRGVLMHRFLLGYTGNLVVDHIDRNPLNNRRSNLEIKSQKDNILNSGIRVDNTSGHKGIAWDKNRKKWLVRIGNGTHIGRFDNFELAVKARQQVEIATYGHRLVPILERR